MNYNVRVWIYSMLFRFRERWGMEGNKDREKRLARYTAKGSPWFVNEHDERVCSLDGCSNKSQDRPICWRHSKDGNDYSFYMTSVQKNMNNYKLINSEYYELSVNNSNLVYKIDKEDFKFAQRYNWWALGGKTREYPYLVSKKIIDRKEKHLRFHVEILKSQTETKDYSKRVIVDHINGDVTDNRKKNLRVRTQSENNMNKIIQSNNTSGIVGVTWSKKLNMWSSDISVNGQRIVLGKYYYLRNAVRARVDAEKEYFGEHSFRKRDESYKRYLDSILSLPSLPEPAIRIRPKDEIGVFGIRKIKNKNNIKYRARVYNIEERKSVNKSFSYLEDAIRWKENKEIEIYGVKVLHKDEKEFKKI